MKFLHNMKKQLLKNQMKFFLNIKIYKLKVKVQKALNETQKLYNSLVQQHFA